MRAVRGLHRLSVVSAFGLPGASEHVVIAGGGFAALEVVLALRAIAGGAARVSLVSPDPVLAYRPAATLEAFSDTAPRAFDLIAIAAELGVRYHRTRVERVGSIRNQVRLASGGRLTYDTLVLAAGARATVGIRGALTFRDQRDLPRLRGLLRELDKGRVGSLVFAVPSGASWPLPLYELALLCAAHARERGTDVEITLVSPGAPAVGGVRRGSLAAGGGGVGRPCRAVPRSVRAWQRLRRRGAHGAVGRTRSKRTESSPRHSSRERES